MWSSHPFYLFCSWYHSSSIKDLGLYFYKGCFSPSIFLGCVTSQMPYYKRSTKILGFTRSIICLLHIASYKSDVKLKLNRQFWTNYITIPESIIHIYYKMENSGFYNFLLKIILYFVHEIYNVLPWDFSFLQLETGRV